MSLPRVRSLAAALAAVVVAGACVDRPPTSPKYQAECPTPVGALTIPDTVSGTLSAASCKLRDNSYADVWTLTITTLGTLQLDLSSTDFDAFLFVRDVNGNLVVQDDDSGPDTDSRIFQTFSPGTYYVHANTFDPGEVGNYTLSVVPVVTP
jgi:hypothetical protein